MERDISGFGEVEKVFVAVVHEAFGLDRFKMAGGDGFSLFCFDRDGFDPVEGVLKHEFRTFLGESENDLMGEKGGGGCGSDIEEKGGFIFHDTADFGGPLLAPGDECGAIRGVIVGAIIDPYVVGR